MVHPHNGILFSAKNKWTKMWRIFKWILSERKQSEKAEYYSYSSYMIIWGKNVWTLQDYQEFPEAKGRKGQIGRPLIIFKAVKFLHIVLKWWYMLYIFQTPRVNCNENCKLWVVMYQYRFIDKIQIYCCPPV